MIGDFIRANVFVELNWIDLLNGIQKIVLALGLDFFCYLFCWFGIGDYLETFPVELNWIALLNFIQETVIGL